MFTILAGGNEFKGILKNYEAGGEDLIIRFELMNNKTIEMTLPNVPPAIIETMNRTGLEKLKNSVLDMNKGRISLTQPIESDGHSVSSGRKIATQSGPRLQLGGGQMIGGS